MCHWTATKSWGSLDPEDVCQIALLATILWVPPALPVSVFSIWNAGFPPFPANHCVEDQNWDSGHGILSLSPYVTDQGGSSAVNKAQGWSPYSQGWDQADQDLRGEDILEILPSHLLYVCSLSVFDCTSLSVKTFWAYIPMYIYL